MINIRKAYQTDAYELINIRDNIWKEEFHDVLPNSIIYDRFKNKEANIEHLKDQISENNRVLVATNDDNIIGYIFYAKSSNIDYEKSAEIREIYVKKEFRGAKVGTKLLTLAQNEIINKGYNYLVVSIPQNISSINFFTKTGGIEKGYKIEKMYNNDLKCNLVCFELKNKKSEPTNEWNKLYAEAINKTNLLNQVNREVCAISTKNGNIYYGIGIINNICPLESALSNMHLNKDMGIDKILILNKENKPVLPCGSCRDLLVYLKELDAKILFDYGALQTITVAELNPYYKDIEKK